MSTCYWASEEHRISPGAALPALHAALASLQEQLVAHPIYDCVGSVRDVRVFMEQHVFAVWDFMALLKALQRHLTCVDSSWRPVGNAGSRRLINEMVLEEESDEIDGVPTSHFELYRTAMREAGADVRPIDKFLDLIAEGTPMEEAFAECRVPAGARAFVRATFELIASGKPHVVCAAFTCGREQVTPRIFQALLDAIPEDGPRLATLTVYLERHIELDGNDHGPKALAMLSALCGDDGRKWREATEAARRALAARIAFWTAITDEIECRDAQPSDSAFARPRTGHVPARAHALPDLHA